MIDFDANLKHDIEFAVDCMDSAEQSANRWLEFTRSYAADGDAAGQARTIYYAERAIQDYEAAEQRLLLALSAIR